MSRVQQILEGSNRVQSVKQAHFATRKTRWGTLVGKAMYGTDFSHQRLNAIFNCRAIVVCGGCVNGFVHNKTPSGTKMNEKVQHPDCEGTGFRLNKFYGRPSRG